MQLRLFVLIAGLIALPLAARGFSVRGNRIGTEMGWPTANITYPVGKFVPANGVYAGLARVGEPDSAPLGAMRKRPPLSLSNMRSRKSGACQQRWRSARVRQPCIAAMQLSESLQGPALSLRH